MPYLLLLFVAVLVVLISTGQIYLDRQPAPTGGARTRVWATKPAQVTLLILLGAFVILIVVAGIQA